MIALLVVCLIGRFYDVIVKGGTIGKSRTLPAGQSQRIGIAVEKMQGDVTVRSCKEMDTIGVVCCFDYPFRASRGYEYRQQHRCVLFKTETVLLANVLDLLSHLEA